MWFKRDVRCLQHMVGSDFLMQIGKDQIKAAWQPINQPSNQTWQLSIMAPSSPRNPIVCSQIVYLIPRKEKKSSEVELFFRLCKEVMRSDQMRTKPLCPPLWDVRLGRSPLWKHCLFLESLLSESKRRWHLGSVNYQGFNLWIIGSESLQQPTHPMGRQ